MATNLECPIILGHRPTDGQCSTGTIGCSRRISWATRRSRGSASQGRRSPGTCSVALFLGELNGLWLAGHELLLEPARRAARRLRPDEAKG